MVDDDGDADDSGAFGIDEDRQILRSTKKSRWTDKTWVRCPCMQKVVGVWDCMPDKDRGVYGWLLDRSMGPRGAMGATRTRNAPLLHAANLNTNTKCLVVITSLVRLTKCCFKKVCYT